METALRSYLFSLVDSFKVQRGPDGYPDEDYAGNDPDNERRYWKRSGLRAGFGENDNTQDDVCHGQPHGDSYR